jgi:hypothetical protein
MNNSAPGLERKLLRQLVVEQKLTLSISQPADEAAGYTTVYMRMVDGSTDSSGDGILSCMVSYQRYKYYKLQESTSDRGSFDTICDQFLAICKTMPNNETKE